MKTIFLHKKCKREEGGRPTGEKSIKNLRVRAPDGALGTGVALRARNLSKSFQNQTESLGRSPGRDFFYRGTLRVEINQKLNSKLFKNYMAGRVLAIG